MEGEGFDSENVQTLAERCRIALESHYGSSIPIPKCITKMKK